MRGRHPDGQARPTNLLNSFIVYGKRTFKGPISVARGFEEKCRVRSYLLVPASSGDALDPALFEEAAVLIVDLAEASAPIEQSRRQAFAFLLRARAARPQFRLFVQISDLSAGLADADLDAILPAAPDGIVLSGCSSGEDVQHLGTKLAVREAEFGIGDAATAIIAVAACDAAALFRMGSYAGSSPRLAGLAWDAARLATTLGLRPDVSMRDLPAPLAFARTLTVLAAHAASVPAIDAACALNGREFAAACVRARSDGFTAKFAMDAAQLPVIEAAFAAPDPPSSA